MLLGVGHASTVRRDPFTLGASGQRGSHHKGRSSARRRLTSLGRGGRRARRRAAPRIDYRSGRKAVWSSWVRSWGCSQAAKWPPRSRWWWWRTGPIAVVEQEGGQVDRRVGQPVQGLGAGGHDLGVGQVLGVEVAQLLIGGVFLGGEARGWGVAGRKALDELLGGGAGHVEWMATSPGGPGWPWPG
jgi:hypothetical protein